MARDPKRIEEMLESLNEAWKSTPDLRLGQLMMCLGSDAKSTDLFYIEDDIILERLKRFTKDAELHYKMGS